MGRRILAGPSAPDRSPADLSLHPKADSSATGAVCRPCSPVPSYSGCRGEEKGAFEKHLSAAEVHSPNHGQKHGQKRKTGRKGPCLLASWRRGWKTPFASPAVRPQMAVLILVQEISLECSVAALGTPARCTCARLAAHTVFATTANSTKVCG